MTKEEEEQLKKERDDAIRRADAAEAKEKEREDKPGEMPRAKSSKINAGRMRKRKHSRTSVVKTPKRPNVLRSS